jgi:hypothetical protein
LPSLFRAKRPGGLAPRGFGAAGVHQWAIDQDPFWERRGLLDQVSPWLQLIVPGYIDVQKDLRRHDRSIRVDNYLLADPPDEVVTELIHVVNEIRHSWYLGAGRASGFVPDPRDVTHRLRASPQILNRALLNMRHYSHVFLEMPDRITAARQEYEILESILGRMGQVRHALHELALLMIGFPIPEIDGLPVT